MGSMTPTAPMAHMNPIMSIPPTPDLYIFLVRSFRIDSMGAPNSTLARSMLEEVGGSRS